MNNKYWKQRNVTNKILSKYQSSKINSAEECAKMWMIGGSGQTWQGLGQKIAASGPFGAQSDQRQVYRHNPIHPACLC